MKKKLSPREQALKDIKAAGLLFDMEFDSVIRKSNKKDAEIPYYHYKQLKFEEV